MKHLILLNDLCGAERGNRWVRPPVRRIMICR